MIIRSKSPCVSVSVRRTLDLVVGSAQCAAVAADV